MIGYLRGTVMDAYRPGHVLLDVQGVGYDVTIANPTGVENGHELSLFIHTSVRPDALVLFGFHSAKERAIFEMLIETPGVGPSTALGAIRSMPVTQLEDAIRTGDDKLIATIPGIGPKTASRMILELRGKLPDSGNTSAPITLRATVIEGLVALGFARKEALKALADVELPDDDADALKVALAKMTSS
jgi:Holliday junction DNA helicase RuvA